MGVPSPPNQPPAAELPEASGANPWTRAVVLLVVVAVLTWIGALRMSPPAVVAAHAPADVFSAERALGELDGFLGDGSPRPVGSLRQTEARAWLVGRLGELGWEVRETTHRAVLPGLACDLVNVHATWPGTERALPPVLLTAHHDSVHAGAGASDDGVGVAALVEIARALAAGTPRRRTVQILVTDGEEMGLLGARLAASELPEGALVVNLEARGTGGPSLVFETSSNDAELAALLADVVPRPVTSSAFVDIYRRLPNDTDFTIWRGSGLRGVNLAFIGGVQRYHTPLDDRAHLDPRSLQHHGDTTLALATALADRGADVTASTDAVFFDVLALGVVHWPAPWTVWIAAGIALLTAVAVLRRRAALRGSELLRALGGVVGLLLGTLLLAGGLAALRLHLGGVKYPASDGWTVAALVLPSLGAALWVVQPLLAPRSGPVRVVVQTLLASAALVLAGIVPTLSYPVLALAAAGAVSLFLPRAWTPWRDLVPVVVCCAVLVPHALLLPGGVGLEVWPVIVGPWAVLAFVATPFLAHGRRVAFGVGTLLLVGGAVAAVVVALSPRHTPESPGHLNLLHVLQPADAGSVNRLLVARAGPGVQLPAALRELGFDGDENEWTLPLEPVSASDLPAPTLKVVEVEPGTGRVRVLLTPSGPDRTLTLLAEADVGVWLDGRAWDGRGREWLERECLTPPIEGVELELTLSGATTVLLRETRMELGDGAELDAAVRARGDALVPRQWPDRTDVWTRWTVAPPESRR